MTSRATSHAVLLAMFCATVSGQESRQPRTATKQEYAACLEQADYLENQKSNLKMRSDDHNSLGSKLQAADESLNSQVKRNPPKNRDGWASYNRAIDKRNAATKEYNDKGKELEQAQQAMNAKILNFNERCGSLFIDQEVKAEVEEEHRRKNTK